MNKFDLISYEIHDQLIWTSYEAHTKFTMNPYVVQTNFIWSYEYMFSYGFHMNEVPGPAYVQASSSLLQDSSLLLLS